MGLIVFGSLNMDLIALTPNLPSPGETLFGDQFLTIPGGKGGNQAVAASRLGANTTFVGRVGKDSFGAELLSQLQRDQVNTHSVVVDPDNHSGVAIILVDPQGENRIIVIPGANGNVNAMDAEKLTPLLPAATALLLQLEIPISAILAAAKLAYNAGVKVILDPAPAPDALPDELYPMIDMITPNETEAKRLTGLDVTENQNWAKAAEFFLKKGVKTTLLKLGAKGVFCMNASQRFHVEPFKVNVMDTVAAGDAFNGALATALDRGLSLREAVIWGAAAGALTTTQTGAQSALPDWETFKQLINSPD